MFSADKLIIKEALIWLIMAAKDLSAAIDNLEVGKRTLKHSWLIHSELCVNLKVAYCTTVANAPGNLFQDWLQSTLLSSRHGLVKIFPHCVDEVRVVSTKCHQIGCSTLDALALRLLSVKEKL